MKVKVKCAKPEDIVYTITITATVAEFKELDKQLGKAYPSWRLSEQITNLRWQANKTFTPEEENK